MTMQMPIPMQYSLQEEAKDDDWLPGRYHAFVREECTNLCLRVNHATLGCHEHFDFNRADILTYFTACKRASAFLEDLVRTNPTAGLTVNDWRRTSGGDIEMKLDAPGSCRPHAVVVFGGDKLEQMRDFYWVAEEHAGGLRAKRVADESCIRLTTPHPSDHNNLVNQHQANDVRDQPLLQELVAGPNVTHIDGDMLNNRPENLDVSMSTNTSPARKRKKTKLSTNNTTGVTGLSMAADQSRFHVKVHNSEGELVRKSFTVLSASTAEEREACMLDAHTRAMEFYIETAKN